MFLLPARARRRSCYDRRTTCGQLRAQCDLLFLSFSVGWSRTTGSYTTFFGVCVTVRSRLAGNRESKAVGGSFARRFQPRKRPERRSPSKSRVGSHVDSCA
jgi:hypothetical protein